MRAPCFRIGGSDEEGSVSGGGVVGGLVGALVMGCAGRVDRWFFRTWSRCPFIVGFGSRLGTEV